MFARVLKIFLQFLLKLVYRVELRGLENYEKAGPRAVIISNHVSYLDAPLLASFLPGRPMFALNTVVARWWWLQPFLKLVRAFPVDATNPYAMKTLINEVRKDNHCIIFPEGRLSQTGALMKIYEGPGMVADKAGAVIVPVRLDGVQHTPFARLRGKVPLRHFPKITITILPPREFTIPEGTVGRKRRHVAARQLHDVMEEMMFVTQDRHQTLFHALLKARYINGDKATILEDATQKHISMKKLIRGAVVLGRKIGYLTKRGENVGMLLPNAVGSVVAFFGLQAYGRIPALLNFTAGEHAVLSACETAELKTVLTSRRFIELGRLEKLEAALGQKVKLVYLEDLRDDLSLRDKLYALLMPAAWIHRRKRVKPEDPAVILFTSGSEGKPKGVVLSHENLMANVVQLSVRIDFNQEDVVFNCLPMFHSFGLTAGTLLPVLCGVKTVLYPSPLHYRMVPERVYHTNATIMFGTDTFLRGYARMAHPYDFYRIRYIFAGAEKIQEETRRQYMDRFGVRVLEGYGSTETAPVIAVNSAMHFKAGSVGRFLTGLETRLDPVEGVEKGGRLFVRGPNVMIGYLEQGGGGKLRAPEGGWYDTGDVVDVDDGGFVSIVGRAKRFAKIGGEMVSLAAVENIAATVYPDDAHAVASMPDAKKGERLVLVTTAKDAKREALARFASENGLSELLVPRDIRMIDDMPVMGTGKVDHKAVQKWVTEEG